VEPKFDMHVRLDAKAAGDLAYLIGIRRSSSSAVLRECLSQMAEFYRKRSAPAAPQAAPTKDPPNLQHCPDCSHALVPGQPHTCNFD
jgi:hypothetical protein